MAENSTEFSTFNSNQNTEIINNYSCVQDVGYDDTKVISLLGGIAENLGKSAIEPMNKSVKNVPETVVDLSLLDSLISGMRSGDIQNIDNSRLFDNTYNNDYSRIVENSFNYGDTTEVFNTDPSLRIQNDDDRTTSEDASSYRYFESSEYSETVSKKEFTININGSEPIVVKSNDSISKEDVLEIVVDNLKPALASIISVEKLEEGDSSYDY